LDNLVPTVPQRGATRAIAAEYVLKYKRLATGLLRGLVEEMRDNGLLQDPPARVLRGLAEWRRQQSPSAWLTALPHPKR
jgi:hypothetical protein